MSALMFGTLMAASAAMAASPDDVKKMGVVCSNEVVPRLPVQAVRQGIEGSVTARALLVDGQIREVVIMSGPELFHDAVANTIWQYRCAPHEGRVIAQQTFDFRFEGSTAPIPQDTAAPSFTAGVPDVASLRRLDGVARLRVLYDTGQPASTGAQRSYRSGTILLELDCARQRYRVVTIVLHGRDNDGRGYALPARMDGPIVMRGASSQESRFWSLGCEGSVPPRDAAAAEPVIWLTGSGAPAQSLALDRRYDQLSAEEREHVKSQYAPMAEGDEPPFPASGLRSLHEAMVEAQRIRIARGPLRVHAQIDATGVAKTVSVLESPDPELTQYVGAALVRTRFKPVLCAGQPCAMSFPLRVEFTPP